MEKLFVIYCDNYGLFIINNYIIILIKTKMLNIHYQFGLCYMQYIYLILNYKHIYIIYPCIFYISQI